MRATLCFENRISNPKNSSIVAKNIIFGFLNIQYGYFVIHLKCNAIPLLESV